jgi:hypothetical protein
MPQVKEEPLALADGGGHGGSRPPGGLGLAPTWQAEVFHLHQSSLRAFDFSLLKL